VNVYEQTRAAAAQIRAGADTLTADQHARLDQLATDYVHALTEYDGARA
jgi:hypothetical protein